METLNSTEPHYVRCVKPNSLNQPKSFEKLSILHQLRCGVSELFYAYYELLILLALCLVSFLQKYAEVISVSNAISLCQFHGEIAKLFQMGWQQHQLRCALNR